MKSQSPAMARALSLDDFHPAVAAWFRAQFTAPTPAQQAAWPAIRRQQHTLVAAPTGSGKTLTAFLAAIDALVREGLEQPDGVLAPRTSVLYISPLKALSNDVQINLEAPLAGIRAELARRGLPEVQIRTAVRTGDTPQRERALLRRQPAHILVTTPESLYVLLGSDSGRAMLGDVRTVIVDEIHALASSKRGAHLSLSLERLQALSRHQLLRIGLSATQKPIEEIARFLLGSGGADTPAAACHVVDIGHVRQRDLALALSAVPLEAVMSNDAWALVYDRVATLAQQHRTTLVFVNTRRLAERAARHLSERLGNDAVAAHHGSLAKEQRLDAEQRLKRGELRVLVATASLELGIDIGDVELVCQLGSPRSIAAFLQRAGRAGHAVGGVSKARLFPTSRDDLAECTALLDCVRRGELDSVILPPQPLDVLAQQIVAEVACQDWDEDALFAMVRRAHAYRELERAEFEALLRMLTEGYSTRLGVRGAYIHRDAVHRQLRSRRGARLTASTSGGTIPDTADYSVVLEPQATIIGTVNEDFAVESLAGDVFQLGNHSYRIQRVERDRLRVEDAHGAPPNIPFWLGEAPGRSNELSLGVSRLRQHIADQLDAGGAEAARAWLQRELGLDENAATQLIDYFERTHAALGTLPTQRRIVLERFFDESGGTQLVIHSPWGSRINRAWGLALRKRFCRQFNFELQAAATEDAIVLSLSTSHSFPLDEVARYLHSSSAEQVLTQALLDAPLFPARWRWNATTALALPRMRGGKKTPPQLQRMKSEDLLATIFPDQVACLENIVGEREIPDHPLVKQTLYDCLRVAMDTDGLLALLRGLENGSIEIVARDLASPSPFSAEVLNAAPYAFLDDAPLEERRTQAVQSRRWNSASATDELGRLDPDAIVAVREEAWPRVRDADEMHEALTLLGGIHERELAAYPAWREYLERLADTRRATRLILDGGQTIWCSAEKLPAWRALHEQARLDPPIDVPAQYAAETWTAELALTELMRARLSGLGPVDEAALAAGLAVKVDALQPSLYALQAQGYVMQGRFSPAATATEWCERHLLARIHRYTLGRLRREIEPVSRRDLMRFLIDWQHASPSTRLRGPDALSTTLAQLEGYEAAAAAWESELLPARIADYSISWLDEQCRAGRIGWQRLRGGGGNGPLRSSPIVLMPRRHLANWASVARSCNVQEPVSSRAQAVLDALKIRGALFFDELQAETRLLRTELENALSELVAVGQVSADSFAGLRALLIPSARRGSDRSGRRSRRLPFHGIEDAGRWALTRNHPGDGVEGPRITHDEQALEHIARTLLRRYGVVFWKLLEREAPWLPPWRQLLSVYRRLEARGEIRGGRFVDGPVGEQFALPEAIGRLRATRQTPENDELVMVSGCDPLNLIGTLWPGAKLAALAGNRLFFRNGIPTACLAAGKLQWLVEPEPDIEQAIRQVLSGQQRKTFSELFI